MTKAANLAASANATLGNVTATTIQSNSASTPTVFQDSAGTQIGTLCRAWVNFNGTGTVAIRASFNVSSITDNGTGDYTVNFTNALPDTNFSVTAIGNGFSSFEDTGAVRTGARTTSSIRVGTTNGIVTAYVDATSVQVAIFR